MKLSDITPALPKLILILSLLATVAFLAVDGICNANDAFGFLGLIIGVTAVAGTIVLSDAAQPNVNLVPHLIVFIAVIAYAAVLAYKGLFSGTEVVGVFSILIGGGALAAGSTTPTPNASAVSNVTAPTTPGNGPPAITDPSEHSAN